MNDNVPSQTPPPRRSITFPQMMGILLAVAFAGWLTWNRVESRRQKDEEARQRLQGYADVMDRPRREREAEKAKARIAAEEFVKHIRAGRFEEASAKMSTRRRLTKEALAEFVAKHPKFQEPGQSHIIVWLDYSADAFAAAGRNSAGGTSPFPSTHLSALETIDLEKPRDSAGDGGEPIAIMMRKDFGEMEITGFSKMEIVKANK